MGDSKDRSRWIVADEARTLAELERRLGESGRYDQAQIDRLLALVVEVREQCGWRAGIVRPPASWPC
jgi:hypothetical protein